MKQNLLIYPLLFVAMLLVVLTGCEKDGNDFNKDDDDIEKDSENVNNFKTFTDSRDDNVYKYVTIGDQAWMAENLKYLPSVVGSATRSINTPFYYVYSYEGFNVTDAKATENYETYGVLYNFQAARNACPDGWYLPKTEQWHDLLDVVGFDGSKLQAPGSIQAGTGLWSRYFDTTTKTYIDGGTNETGFSALPGGYLPMDEAFQYINHNAYWWRKTPLRKKLCSCMPPSVIWPIVFWRALTKAPDSLRPNCWICCVRVRADSNSLIMWVYTG